MPSNYERYLENKFYWGLWNLMKKYVYSWEEIMWWLVKRRNDESEIIVNWFII